MINLSVVIITFNEEKNIGRCLESVKDIADDILVVDSFSTDRTRDISQSYGARFIEHKFEGHIQQKNFATQQAIYNHVLSLDADEVLSEELIVNIKHSKENFIADGYHFNRLNNYCGKWIKHGGWYPDRKLRLWDRRKGVWGGENPHDQFIMQANSKVLPLKGNLYHYTFTSIKDHLNQMQKFNEIGAQIAFDKGRKVSLIKIIFYPLWKFKRDYIFKAGFLDGYYGFIIAVISSFGAFLKCIYLRQLYTTLKT